MKLPAQLYSQKLKLLIVFVLVLVVGVGFYSLRLYQSRENGNVLGESVPVTVSLSPNQGSLPPDLPVSVAIDAKTNKLVIVRLVILFDQTKVHMATEATVNAVFGTLVSKSSMEEANSTGKLIVVAAVTHGSVPPSGIINDVVTFTLSPLSETPNDQVQLSFDTNDMQLVESDGITAVAIIPNSALYTLNPVATPTPTETPTPLPTSTPTPIPTSTPTSTPSPTPTSTGDTQPPTVSVTNPVNGGVVTTGSTVTITATATDNVEVTKVEFYVNGKRRCTDTSAPYECSWVVSNNPASYTIQARAYDAQNNITNHQITVTSSN